MNIGRVRKTNLRINEIETKIYVKNKTIYENCRTCVNIKKGTKMSCNDLNNSFKKGENFFKFCRYSFKEAVSFYKEGRF